MHHDGRFNALGAGNTAGDRHADAISPLTVDDQRRPLKLSRKQRFRSDLLDTFASFAG